MRVSESAFGGVISSPDLWCKRGGNKKCAHYPVYHSKGEGGKGYLYNHGSPPPSLHLLQTSRPRPSPHSFHTLISQSRHSYRLTLRLNLMGYSSRAYFSHTSLYHGHIFRTMLINTRSHIQTFHIVRPRQEESVSSNSSTRSQVPKWVNVIILSRSKI